MWAVPVWAADTINTLTSASDYGYVVAENQPFTGTKSLSCNCVLFAKDYLGITETLGIAKYIKPTSQIPKVRSIVLLNQGPLGHVGVVLDIYDDEIWIVEANLKTCMITYRSLNINDKVIKGYKYKSP